MYYIPMMYRFLTAAILIYNFWLCSGLEDDGDGITQDCFHLQKNQPCNLYCPKKESTKCTQECTDSRVAYCNMDCPVESLGCHQICEIEDKCKRINCKSKECRQTCYPSCKYMECINEKRCVQELENSRGFCRSNICEQVCWQGLCNVTCDTGTGICAQYVSNKTHGTCNARRCFQVCIEGECDLKCQENAPNHENCTQTAVEPIEGTVEATSRTPTEDPTEDFHLEEVDMDSEFWGNMSYNYTTISEDYKRKYHTIKMSAICYGKRCDQLCSNATCSLDCRNGEFCHQKSLEKRSNTTGKCSSKKCVQTCIGPASCDYTCYGKECNLTCLSAEKLNKPCALRCKGDSVDTCIMSCSGYSECIMDCGKSKKCKANGKLSFSHAAIWQVISFMIYMVVLAQIYMNGI